jgi:hypothetical protein
VSRDVLTGAFEHLIIPTAYWEEKYDVRYAISITSMACLKLGCVYSSYPDKPGSHPTKTVCAISGSLLCVAHSWFDTHAHFVDVHYESRNPYCTYNNSSCETSSLIGKEAVKWPCHVSLGASPPIKPRSSSEATFGYLKRD